MRRIAALAVLGIAVSLALWGASAGAAQHTTTVPAQVRNAIAHTYPAMAWIPGRLPSGYRFAHWTHSKKTGSFGYRLKFTKLAPGGAPSNVKFEVLRRTCPAAPSWPADGTFRINGRSISWSKTSTEAYAWRCVQGFVLFGETGPVRQNATLVAYARPAG